MTRGEGVLLALLATMMCGEASAEEAAAPPPGTTAPSESTPPPAVTKPAAISQPDAAKSPTKPHYPRVGGHVGVAFPIVSVDNDGTAVVGRDFVQLGVTPGITVKIT